jgi:hypothetical protein
MPKALEAALGRAYEKGKRKKKIHGDKDSFVYGTMTNMQKKGEIAPWRTLKGGK